MDEAAQKFQTLHSWATETSAACWGRTMILADQLPGWCLE